MPRLPIMLCAVLLTAALPPPAAARSAEPAPAPVPLRIQLKIVDACRLDAGARPAACATPHRRSDADTPTPPQVQALTPPMDAGPDAQRAWHTLTF
ncbi:hypothetical protein [Stenotrophomonas sp. PS02289]|uniref:hypothetical protein n=1 Tax=Stenotrophomonas sp. PS02289 TaxID=2991422 RepID=UPI002499D867|nr:hypothetical protein [Stenotrophomonas sp. PS02289]